jgi:hypothetical protein
VAQLELIGSNIFDASMYPGFTASKTDDGQDLNFNSACTYVFRMDEIHNAFQIEVDLLKRQAGTINHFFVQYKYNRKKFQT